MYAKPYTKTIFAGLIPLVALTSVEAQTPAQRSGWGTDNFLERKTAQHMRRADQLGRVGRASNLGELNALVRAVASRLPAAEYATSAAQRKAVQDAFLVDVAQRLAIMGFNAGDIRSARGGGERLVTAAANFVSGSASLGDYALLSSDVVVGTVKAVNEAEQLGDGYNSTVTFTVEEVLKGSTTSGSSIGFRQESGLLPDRSRWR